MRERDGFARGIMQHSTAMCGVAAIIVDGSRGGSDPHLDARIRAMTAAQAHRGPDHGAVWSDGVVALGHRRLRVVDLGSEADQPFRDDHVDAPVLSYNGEIYNARELRRELSVLGSSFRTLSDMEVLYRALQQWGAGAFSRLKGMYAFVYYDPAQARVWVARDRMGIKPMHFARISGVTLFASECESLLASGLIDPALDPHAVYQIARFNHTLGRRTALAAVSSLAPGSLYALDLRSGVLSTSHVNSIHLESDASALPKTFGARAKDLNALFVTAVERHLESDVPVGVYLSGGVDSSGVAAEVAKRRSATSYSLLFPNSACDETEAIAQTSARLAMDNTRVSMSAVSFDDYIRYVVRAEMPQLWTTDLSLMKLASAARRGGHCVVLSGEGPDELFAGYDAYRWMTLRRRIPRALRSLFARTGMRVSAFDWFSADASLIRFYLEEHERAESENLEETYGFYPENVASSQIVPRLAPGVFSSEFLSKHYEDEVAQSLRAVMGTSKQSVQSANVLFELAVRLPNWVLHMSDRMSAAEGVELRVPYLDDDFVNYALRLEDADRIHGLEGKRILREMHRERLPRAVRKRAKIPLYTPITEWIQSFFDDPRFDEYINLDSAFFDRQNVLEIAAVVRSQRFASMADKLAKEWALLLVLSTNILTVHFRTTVQMAKHQIEGGDA
jgi:asparagine synthase (glutamine-hydrolysing)